MSANLIELLVKSLGETCYMVLIAIVLATLIGLPLGVILTVTRKDHIMPNALVHNVLGAIVNATRSTPFIILMVAIIPFTRMIVGSSIGTTAAIVPLTITAAPFIASGTDYREGDAAGIVAFHCSRHYPCPDCADWRVRHGRRSWRRRSG